MLIYFSALFIASITMFFLQRTKKSLVSYKILYLIVFSALVLPAALRSSNVGTDTNNYVGSFKRINLNEEMFFSQTKSFELGYQFLEKSARLISDQYWVLFFVIAFIVIFSYMKAIRELSINYAISMFIFVSLGVYLFFFNGARQGLAAAIYSIAFIHLVKGNFKKYLLWVIVASLFHKTVFFTLPFYYIFRLKHSTLNIIIASIISIIAVYFSGYFLQLFPETFSLRYSVYKDRGSTGAVLLTIFFVISGMFFILLRPLISKKDLISYDIYLNMNVLTLIIYLIVSVGKQDVNIVRLTLYFSLGYILIWPLIFKNAKFFSGLFARVIFYTIHLLFLYIFISKMSNLLPYEFNPYFF